MTGSPFLAIPATEHIASNGYAFAVLDRFAVSEGHALVIPRRLVASFFELSPQERSAVFALVDEVVAWLEERHAPDGFNIGVNVGEAAGQTVMHVHVHVIPRYAGDVDDPAGGVRFVIPEKGNYRRPGFIPRRAPAPEPRRLATGGAPDPFITHLQPLFAKASAVKILAAFVQHSGVLRLRGLIEEALARGAGVEILTGDYLHITQEKALGALLDLSRSENVGAGLGGEEGVDEAFGPAAPLRRGTLGVRVVESAALARGDLAGVTFHPKAWIFQWEQEGVAFVGSSNMSKAALTRGIEWNLRVERQSDPGAFGEVLEGWERLQREAVELDEAWITRYAAQLRAAPPARVTAPLPGEHAEAEEQAPEPRDLQAAALARLRQDRAEGRERAVVVLATGLGKTWLAAFDVRQFVEERGGRPVRVLFVAHRVELLRQASETFRRLFPTAQTTFYMGASDREDGELVFASVFKLGRRANLARFARDAFDYIVMDEVHHATADSWRRIVEHFEARFLLGLTATPERTDGGDVLGLFDDHVAYEAGVARGIEAGHLVPFAYFGLADTVEYAALPWRNRSFDPAALEAAVVTEARMVQIWRGWEAHPGTRTLVFCCSVRHAVFSRNWLIQKGLKVKAVHSGEGSDARDEALQDLAAGELDAVCSVDLFNEGVDVPAVDRVVMLRPTESPVLFLQQLGRGLRVAPEHGKTTLTVLDLVGNHRMFLQRLRQLIELGEGMETGLAALRRLIEGTGHALLPAGCSVELDLAAVDLLRALLPKPRGGGFAAEAYRELRYARGERPTAGELLRMGYNPATLRPSWFEFVEGEGDLSDAEALALRVSGAWLRELFGTRVSKSYKLVTVEAMIEAGGLLDGVGVAELAERCGKIMQRSPELRGELPEEFRQGAAGPAWARYWRAWPLNHWTASGRKQEARGVKAWFHYEGERFAPDFALPTTAEAREALVAMSRELVDYRLAQRRRRSSARAPGEPDTEGDQARFVCRLFHNQTAAILKLPDRAKAQEVPLGEVEVRLPDGARWVFSFVKIACNVARPVGTSVNRLGELLVGWFGERAGMPGTAHAVVFRLGEGGWRVEPVES